MKIRIGNDVSLRIQIKLGDSTDYANIQSAQAFFVNTTLKDKLEAEYKNKNRFIGRFPIEPFVNEFQPTPYNINSLGYPKYHTYVFNEYKGFGVQPEWENCFPIKEVNITEYRAEIQHTNTPSVIQVLFPAEAQLYTGKYKLVIVARVYDPGYKNQVRTITTDYNNLFELVDNIDDADVNEASLIEITNTSETDELQDVYVVSGQYNDDFINIRRNDGGVIHVDISPVSSWYENNTE